MIRGHPPAIEDHPVYHMNFSTWIKVGSLSKAEQKAMHERGKRQAAKHRLWEEYVRTTGDEKIENQKAFR
jgi:hypothetical protein